MRLYAVWIAAVLSEFLGGMDAILCPLIIFMIVEYSTGLLCCIVGKRRFSNRGVKAVFRKLTILCLVGIANTLEKNFLEQDRSYEQAWFSSIFQAKGFLF